VDPSQRTARDYEIARPLVVAEKLMAAS